jgi:hypothetical protein
MRIRRNLNFMSMFIAMTFDVQLRMLSRFYASLLKLNLGKKGFVRMETQPRLAPETGTPGPQRAPTTSIESNSVNDLP